MPSIACTIFSDEKDENIRHWRYTPFPSQGTKRAVDRWAKETVSTRFYDKEVDTEAFAAEINQLPIPYATPSGTQSLVHFYLLLNTWGDLKSVHSLFIHGPHSLMDARPTIRTLNLMLLWMIDPPSGPRLEWGNEVGRLPVGPLTATGGPREDWDMKGVELMTQAMDQSIGVGVKSCVSAVQRRSLIFHSYRLLWPCHLFETRFLFLESQSAYSRTSTERPRRDCALLPKKQGIRSVISQMPLMC